jgi:hypothetical protein
MGRLYEFEYSAPARFVDPLGTDPTYVTPMGDPKLLQTISGYGLVKVYEDARFKDDAGNTSAKGWEYFEFTGSADPCKCHWLQLTRAVATLDNGNQSDATYYSPDINKKPVWHKYGGPFEVDNLASPNTPFIDLAAPALSPIKIRPNPKNAAFADLPEVELHGAKTMRVIVDTYLICDRTIQFHYHWELYNDGTGRIKLEKQGKASTKYSDLPAEAQKPTLIPGYQNTSGAAVPSPNQLTTPLNPIPNPIRTP